MALLWMDGFDGTNTAAGDARTYIKRHYLGGIHGEWDARIGQYGLGYALSGKAHELHSQALSTTDRTLYVGFAFKSDTYVKTVCIISLLQPPGSGVGENVCEGINFYYQGSTQEIQVYRGGTLLWTTDTGGSISSGYWHWLEFKVYCDQVDGAVEIRCGGRTILSETGDTQVRAGVNYHNALYIENSTSRRPNWDNLYVCDSTGAKNNNFLGPVRIVTLSPESDGDESSWTPQTGSDHYVMVDEMPLLDTDEYVDSTTAGDKDLWEYDAVANIGSTIYAVQVITDAKSVEGAPARLKTLTKTGVTETVDAGWPLKADFIAIPRLMEVQPGGLGDWTETALNAYQFGVQHTEV